MPDLSDQNSHHWVQMHKVGGPRVNYAVNAPADTLKPCGLDHPSASSGQALSEQRPWALEGLRILCVYLIEILYNRVYIFKK